MTNHTTIVSFDVFAKEASFRDISTNSSALTYLFPPLPTLTGMIGAMLGYHQEYAERLSSGVCQIGAHQIGGSYRTMMMQMNYLKQYDGRKPIAALTYEDGNVKYFAPPLKLDGEKLQRYLENKENPMPVIDKNVAFNALVPREWIVPSEDNGRIGYRIFFTHQDEQMVHEVYERAKHLNPVFPVSLGKASSLATLENPRMVQTTPSSSSCVTTKMAVPCEKIQNYCVEQNREEECRMIRHFLPRQIIIHPDTQERILTKSHSYYVEQDGKPFTLELTEHPLVDEETGEAIIWL